MYHVSYLALSQISGGQYFGPPCMKHQVIPGTSFKDQQEMILSFWEEGEYKKITLGGK